MVSQTCLVLIALVGPLAAIDNLEESRRHADRGEFVKAIEFATKAIAEDAESPTAFGLRGSLYELTGRYKKAIEDYTKATQLAPDSGALWDRRGGAHFKAGNITQSIKDFDQAIKLNPSREPGHWQRGISYYYAGEFEKGIKQFEGYQKVDDNDVENAVWRFLCMARKDGLESARKRILKIKNDRRVPMMQIYEMFRGTMTPDDVLMVAQAGEPSKEQLNRNLFYAHQYLGLYYEATNEQKKAKKHTLEAEKHRIQHYMWDVARVHANMFRASTKAAKD